MDETKLVIYADICHKKVQHNKVRQTGADSSALVKDAVTSEDRSAVRQVVKQMGEGLMSYTATWGPSGSKAEFFLSGNN